MKIWCFRWAGSIIISIFRNCIFRLSELLNDKWFIFMQVSRKFGSNHQGVWWYVSFLLFFCHFQKLIKVPIIRRRSLFLTKMRKFTPHLNMRPVYGKLSWCHHWFIIRIIMRVIISMLFMHCDHRFRRLATIRASFRWCFIRVIVFDKAGNFIVMYEIFSFISRSDFITRWMTNRVVIR